MIALGLAACQRPASGAFRETQKIMECFNLNQSYKGEMDWDLKAQKAILKEEAHQAALGEPRIDVYKNGKIATQLAARQGQIKTDTHDMHLSSSVVVHSLEDNSTLKTEELDYSASRKKFFTDKEVLVTHPDGVVRGRGMEANSDLSEIRIFEQTGSVEKKKKG